VKEEIYMNLITGELVLKRTGTVHGFGSMSWSHYMLEDCSYKFRINAPLEYIGEL